MILEVSWDGLWTLSFGLSLFHRHDSWLVCEVTLILIGHLYLICVWLAEGQRTNAIMIHAWKEIRPCLQILQIIVQLIMNTIWRTNVISQGPNKYAPSIIITKSGEV